MDLSVGVVAAGLRNGARNTVLSWSLDPASQRPFRAPAGLTVISAHR